MKNIAQISIDAAFDTPIGRGYNTIGGIVSLILNISFVVAGIILLVSFILAGFGVISGAGGNSPEKLEKGKQAMTSTAIGFIVVFAAYWIVKLIEELIPGFKLL